MKFSSLALNLALTAAMFSAPFSMRASDNNPPEQMTYQGFLADANGAGLAPTSPLNYDAVFRIYDASTGGNLLWSESQIITVDKGQFSVILGQGAQNGSEARPLLSSVFASASASDRFIAINVKVGATAMDILPRLRLVPGAYSFLAKNANNLVDSRGTNVINTVAPGLVGINKIPATALDVNGTVTATAFAGNGAALTGITAGQVPSLDASKVTTGVLDNARLPSNVALLDKNPQAFTGVNTFGSVGINTTSPTGKLHVNGGVAVTGSSSPYATGTVGLFMEYGGTANVYAYDYSNGGGPKTMILQSPGGNVGVGTDPGSNKLQVGGLNHSASGYAFVASGSAYGATIQFNRGAGSGGAGLIVDNSANGDIADLILARNNVGSGTSQNQFVVKANGNVGIGTYFPGYPLEVNGTVYDRGHLYVDGFVYNRFGGVYYALNNGGNGNTVTWSSSDQRLKKEVETLSGALETLGRLRGVSYHWNEQGLAHLTRDIETTWRSASGTDEDNKKLWAEKKQEALKRLETQQTGFIAQEVEKVFPSWVRTDDKGYKQINVDQLAGVMVAGINELRQKGEAQESELKELRTEVGKLRHEKKTLADTISDLKARDEAREARLAQIEKALSAQAAKNVAQVR